MSSASASGAAKKPPARSQLRNVQTEVLERDAPLRLEIVPGVTVAVKPPRQWRLSALTAIRDGDFEAFAKKAMASTGDYETFMDADPTIEQVETFMTALGEASTEGNSPTSSVSSRR